MLFICTTNIFRSRFSEEVYNHLVRKKNISSAAFSAGLKVGAYKTRKIYKPALDQLELLKIHPMREDELSIHVNNIVLSDYVKIICLDEKEHRPMIQNNNLLKDINIEYWNIVDEPAVSSNISLPICYKKVEKLVSQVSAMLD